MKHRYIDIISAVLILVFAYTGTNKLIELERFRAIIILSPIISWAADILSWSLPIIEIVTAALLFIPHSRKLGLRLSLIMMGLFTVYIGYMTFFDSDHSCSCGGVLESMTWNVHLVFNIILTIATGIGLWLTNKDIIAISRSSRKPV